MNIEHNYFSDESQVQAEIEAAGYHAVTLDFEAENNDPHWHDFDSLVYVLDGQIAVTDEQTGESCVCEKGAKITAPRGVLHREKTPGYRAMIGLSVKPEELTQPLNKPPPVVLDLA